MTTAPLGGPIRRPLSGRPPRQLVVLLHGLGADGDDLIGLAPHWARLLPEAEFVAPHAPQPCDRAPFGRQWFSLLDFSPASMLRGVCESAPTLDSFLDYELARTGLSDDRLALVGFSQGTMMALHVGLRRARPPGAILGYSGMLIGPELLPAERRSAPPVLLIHGDSDEVVPVQALDHAVAGLAASEVAAEWHVCTGLGHSIDQDGLVLGGRFLVDRLGPG